MGIKQEFYELIAKSFTPRQVETAKEAIVSIEAEISPNDIKYLYYEACSLFYRTAKDFNTFIYNLRQREKKIDAIEKNLKNGLVLEEKHRIFYDKCHKKIRHFCKSHKDKFDVNDFDGLVYALTNVIVPELLALDKIENKLSY